MRLVLEPFRKPLRPLLGYLLQLTLAGGRFSFPATLQPTVLCVGNGALLMEGTDGCWRPLSALNLCGMSSACRQVDALPGTTLLLVSVRAGQLPRLFGPAAGEFADGVIPIADLVPAEVLEELFAQLADSAPSATLHAALESALLACHDTNGRRPADLYVPNDWLFSPQPVIARQLGLSSRQFERRFRSSTGLSLRAFRQLYRWSRLVRGEVFGQRQAPNWAAAACDGGYVDQAHLHRDFRRFTGWTPGDLGRRLAGDDPTMWPYRLQAGQIARLFPDAA